MAKKNYSGKFVLRIPGELHKELSERAEENGISLNSMVSIVLKNESKKLPRKRKINLV